MTGKLILCATPIGNLGDTSARLRDALATADLVYAEDTRRAAKLLRALDVRTSLRSYFVGNEQDRAQELSGRLADGETIALVTDAGMPSIADPGLSAVRAAVAVGAEVTVVPGPSAATAALAISGFPAERFVFEGFLPRKGKERRSRLEAIAAETRTTVLFGAKARLMRDLTDLRDYLGGVRQLVVTRELTKAFEEVWRGSLDEAVDAWSEREPRGEFTFVIAGAAEEAPDIDHAVSEVNAAINAGESMTNGVRRVATRHGVSRRELYEAVLRSQQ
ncbi:MAG: 16S rRNA (cytidine(1402)-2'-O)-methyltransferase [Acidimicrobiia bacterium]|nr:16S rRNA (cytidine(1402)-2'-O)-methyltransferase [Acidimicrobiia bacterium]